jgi:hypothetical protein
MFLTTIRLDEKEQERPEPAPAYIAAGRVKLAIVFERSFRWILQVHFETLPPA